MAVRIERKALSAAAVVVALWATALPALAQQQVRIGVGFGLAFLPVYICEDLKLVEKHAKEAHLGVIASYPRLPGAGPMQDALASGDIDVAPFGIAPLLAAWERAKNTPRQILAVSGITSMPLELLSNRPNIHSIADFKPADRIAMPSLTAPQMYLLEMQSEKVFGQYDRLRGQVVAESPSASINALVLPAGILSAYFSSPPFTEIGLRDAALHGVLSSAEVVGGKASFLVLGATRGYIATNPKVPDVIDKAMEDAARMIRDDPRQAAQIYLTHEPSKTLDGVAIEAALGDIKDEFGSAIYGAKVFADFMVKLGELETSPQSWKDIAAPALLNSSSS